jgi:flagellar basal body-associated protein FliL
MSEEAPIKSYTQDIPGYEKLVALREFIRELYRCLRSPDAPTRRGAIVFFIAGTLWVGVCIVAVYQIRLIFHLPQNMDLQNAEKEAAARRLEKEKTFHEAKPLMFRAGSFEIQMKEHGRPRVGSVSVAELEVVVQCSTEATCHYLEANTVGLKDQVAAIFLPIEREELMSVEGKERLKLEITNKVNRWLPSGKIEKVYFSRLWID